MILYLDTTKSDSSLIEIKLLDLDHKALSELVLEARFSQAEKLLPSIRSMLDGLGASWSDLSSIEVANEGGSFSALRIGLLTANALAYALGIAVRGTDGSAVDLGGYTLVPAIYDREPNIGPPKKTADCG